MNLTSTQKEHLKTKLLEEQHDLEKRLAQSEHFGLAYSMQESLQELSSYDNHPADIGTELFERGKDIALNENAEFELAKVERALASLNAADGTYGVCAACGTPIPYERLEAIPSAMYCVKHVPDPHVSFDRPVEEDFLQPPFGRTSLDEIDGETEGTEFDGEDAWQIVNSWGTSNSPAMAEDREALHYDNLYIESDENVGYVEALESFLATDATGNMRMVVRNNEYRKYLAQGEGDNELEFGEAEYEGIQ